MMTDVLFSIRIYDAKRSSLYMPFDVVLRDSYADWYKVSCESVGMLMTNARCNSFAIQADFTSMCFLLISFQQARDFGAVLLSSPSLVLGT